MIGEPRPGQLLLKCQVSRVIVSRDLQLLSIRQRIVLLLSFDYYTAVILLMYTDVDQYVGEQR